MTTKDEALKLALEALEMADELEEGYGVDFKKYELKVDKDIRVKYEAAITAIKQALAAPVQEPLFWYKPHPNGMYNGPIHNAQIGDVLRGSEEWVPLYDKPPAAQPAPVQPVALGQEREAFEAWHDSFFVNKGHAAHHRFHDRDGYCIDEIQNQWKGWKERAKRTTLPAAQRQWVGLTDSDMQKLFRRWPLNDADQTIARAIEDKLKEKNT